jgi:hypothetical protein
MRMSDIDEVRMKPWLRLFSTVLVFSLLVSCFALPATVSPAPTSAAATATTLAAAGTQAATAIAAATSGRPRATRTPAATATSLPAGPATSLPPTAAASQAAGTISPSKIEPNIVFILTDDLDAAEIQYMPKLKALIADQALSTWIPYTQVIMQTTLQRAP